MSAGAPRRAGRRPRGVASVEFALCVAVILALLPAALLFGRVFLYYNVLLNATRAAAQYMATAPLGEMSKLDKRLLVIANARQMVVDAAVAARLGVAVAPTTITVLCNGLPCDNGVAAPGTIRLLFTVDVPNDLLVNALWDFQNGEGFTLTLDTTVPYAN